MPGVDRDEADHNITDVLHRFTDVPQNSPIRLRASRESVKFERLAFSANPYL